MAAEVRDRARAQAHAAGAALPGAGKGVEKARRGEHPEAAEAARRRGKSPLTLCLYEAEDRTLQVFESVAKRHSADVGLLMFDEVLVWRGDHSEASLIALGEEATREASARWGAPVRFVYSADA